MLLSCLRIAPNNGQQSEYASLGLETPQVDLLMVTDHERACLTHNSKVFICRLHFGPRLLEFDWEQRFKVCFNRHNCPHLFERNSSCKSFCFKQSFTCFICSMQWPLPAVATSSRHTCRASWSFWQVWRGKSRRYAGCSRAGRTGQLIRLLLNIFRIAWFWSVWFVTRYSVVAPSHAMFGTLEQMPRWVVDRTVSSQLLKSGLYLRWLVRTCWHMMRHYNTYNETQRKLIGKSVALFDWLTRRAKSKPFIIHGW